MRTYFLEATQPNVGLTSVSLGLLRALQRRGLKVAFVKPITKRTSETEPSVLFARTAGVTLEHIPYKGQAPTTQAVLAGEVQMLLSTSSAQMNAFIKEGRVRLLGVSSAQPSPLVPGGVPINQTLPNFQADVWFGLFAPAGTPRDVVAKLNDAIGKALQQPDVKTKFETAGSLPVGSTPEQMVARITEESANWAAIVRDVNIKAE